MRAAYALAAAGLLLAVAAFFGWQSIPTDSGDANAVVATLASTSSTTSIATETTPIDDPDPLWEAVEGPRLDALGSEPAVVPVGLVVDRLGIDAPVDGYGVDRRGQMDVPDNITDVGWYKFGPSPGEDGSAVLAAHVDLAGPGRGLFYELDELDEGDSVSVTYSDGSQTEFRVVARSTYLKDELPLDAIFSREGPPILTLITCGGGFSRSSRSYDSNVVVYAVPVGAADVPAAAS